MCGKKADRFFGTGRWWPRWGNQYFALRHLLIRTYADEPHFPHEPKDLNLWFDLPDQQLRLNRKADHLAGVHADVATTTATSFLTVTRFITQVELRSSLGESDVVLSFARKSRPLTREHQPLMPEDCL